MYIDSVGTPLDRPGSEASTTKARTTGTGNPDGRQPDAMRRDLVDAYRVSMHVRELMRQGWTCKAIADEAGVKLWTVHRLTHGAALSQRDTAAKILAVRGGFPREALHKETNQLVPRTETVRRVRALRAYGWTHAAMREVSGLDTRNLLRGRARYVTCTTHERVAAMYRELTSRPGPAATT